MRVLIVHNISSGFGSDAIFEFERALVRQGDECVLRLMVKDDADKSASLLADAESFDLVVISGGDGTVTSMLYILRNRDVLTCVFPSGTANLFFMSLGNAAEPSALARACRVGRSAHTDLGEIAWTSDGSEQHCEGFSMMAGLGFDAQIMEAAVPAKKAIGQAAYFAAAMANPKPEVLNFRITVDGKVHHCKGISCIVANNAIIQNDIELVPGSTMDDGLLDVLVLEVEETAQLLHPIVAGLVDHGGKKSKRPHIVSYSGKDIIVQASSPTQLQVDGDTLPGRVTSYHARVLPASNKLVVDSLSRYDQKTDAAPLFGDTEEIAFPM